MPRNYGDNPFEKRDGGEKAPEAPASGRSYGAERAAEEERPVSRRRGGRGRKPEAEKRRWPKPEEKKPEKSPWERKTDETLEKLAQFMTQIEKRPPEEKFSTVRERNIFWAVLKGNTDIFLIDLESDAPVAAGLREKISEIKKLADVQIPRALAKAALGVSRDMLSKQEESLAAVSTLEDFLGKIREYKSKMEKIEAKLPPDELIADRDVNEWLAVLAGGALAEARAALAFCREFKIREKDGLMVSVSDHSELKKNVENLEKAIRHLEKLIEAKAKLLIELKHRARVAESVTSEAVQKGEAKREGMFPAEELPAKQIDINEIKKNEVWGQTLEILLREHTFFGREKIGPGERRAPHGEQWVIQELIRNFGPESPYCLTAVQCEDLFYAAKTWLYDRAVTDKTGAGRQAMPEVAKEGGTAADPRPGEKPPSLAKGWKKTLAKALGWAGLGFGAVAVSPYLGVSALAAVATVGGLRMIDNVRHHVLQWRELNEFKKARREDAEFKKALVEHLSFTVANLGENNLRANIPLQNYQNYFENSRRYLAGENVGRERPLSEEELNKTAAAFAVFYSMDDRIERQRIGEELNRSPNCRRWWEFIDLSVGQAVRGGFLGKGWQVSAPLRRLFSGSAWMGVSFGLYAVAREIPVVRPVLRAIAGWKLGGAAADLWAGKKSPENAMESRLNELEADLPKLGGMPLAEMGGYLQRLSECWSILPSVANPIEYARQKERLKKVLMAVLAEKILKEESAYELKGEAIAEKGAEIGGEAERAYASARLAQEAQDARLRRYRIAGRVLGAVGAVALGAWVEDLLKPAPKAQALEGAAGKFKPAVEDLEGKFRRPAEGILEGLMLRRGIGGESGVEFSTEAVVGKGEGVEHAFRRQLESDPKQWGYQGDLNDVKSLRQWSGIKAHQLALQFDYVKGGGLETRVGPWDKVAYVLTGDSANPGVREVLVQKGTGGGFEPLAGAKPQAPGSTDWYEYSYKKPVQVQAEEIEKTLPASKPQLPSDYETRHEIEPEEAGGQSKEYLEHLERDLRGAPADVQETAASGKQIGTMSGQPLLAPENYEWSDAAAKHATLLEEKLRASEELVKQYGDNPQLKPSAEQIKAGIEKEMLDFKKHVANGNSLEGYAVLKEGVTLDQYHQQIKDELEGDMYKTAALGKTENAFADLGNLEKAEKSFTNSNLVNQQRLDSLAKILPPNGEAVAFKNGAIKYWLKGDEVWYRLADSGFEDNVKAGNLDLLKELHQLGKGGIVPPEEKIKEILEGLKKVKEGK